MRMSCNHPTLPNPDSPDTDVLVWPCLWGEGVDVTCIFMYSTTPVGSAGNSTVTVTVPGGDSLTALAWSILLSFVVFSR